MEIRVHSIEESRDESGSFIAYVPVAEDEPGLWGTGEEDIPVLQAEVVRASKPPRAQRRALHYSALSEGSALGEDEVILRGAGSRETVLRMSAGDAELLAGDSVVVQSERLARPGLFVRLRGVRVDFAPDPAQQPWTSFVWLPVARVHRPKRRGCRAIYSVTDTKTDKLEASFAVSGSGVKGEAKFTVETGQELPATSTCKELCVRAKCSIVFGTTYVANEPVAYGTRVLISDIDASDSEYRDLPEHLDLCNWPQDKVPVAGRTMKRLRGASGGVEDAETDFFSIEKEVAGTMALGLDFGKVPLTLSIAYTRTSSQKSALQTRLMPGADYLGYLPRADNPLEKCWTVLGR